MTPEDLQKVILEFGETVKELMRENEKLREAMRRVKAETIVGGWSQQCTCDSCHSYSKIVNILNAALQYDATEGGDA